MVAQRRYGWCPDVPDHRDFAYAAPLSITSNLPISVTLRPGCPDVYDQGPLASDAAQAFAAAFEYDLLKRGRPVWTPSRLMAYYLGRKLERTSRLDFGVQIRNLLKAVSHEGVCPESLWGYDISKFGRRPTKRCFKTASEHIGLTYRRVPREARQIKGALAEGYPIILGMLVYPPFESSSVAKSGIVRMPGRHDEPLGGHAVLLTGYDDVTRRWTLRNSWGPVWGRGGYFTVPYTYLLDTVLADDFWVIY